MNHAPPGLRFSKMHGAGNDFVIVDRRGHDADLEPTLAARLADRHFGVGCDQVITIEAPRSATALARYRIWNADGSQALQCGNGARCVAAWLRRDGADVTDFVLDSPSGPVDVRVLGDGSVSIAMGVPAFDAAAIGLRGLTPSDPYDIAIGGAAPLRIGAVAIGNPHVVLEVDDVEHAEVERIGPLLQQHPAFGAGCNVGFAQVIGSDRIRLRVHERGSGETLACGSGACAAVAVLARRGRVGTRVAVELRGGTLQIDWPGEGHAVTMSGPAAFVFDGEFLA